MKDSHYSIFNSKKTGIIMSVVSLILILCLLTIATYSWVEGGNDGEVSSSNTITFDVSPDLDISGDNVSNDKLSISGFVLREVSSVDGRNVYVPDDSNYGNDDGKTSTDELRFREANPADVYNGKDGTTPPTNMRYLSFSFYISSPSGEDTDVYLSSDSKITGAGAEYVRLSVDTHDTKKVNDGGVVKYEDNPPKVLSSAATSGFPVYSDAVTSINKLGEATAHSKSQKADAFSEYTYTGTPTPLFTIEANKKKSVTITLWLEGTSGDFDDSIVDPTDNVSDLTAHLCLKTSRDYVNTIQVMDLTQETWVDDDNCYLFIFDADKYDSEKPLSENPSYRMTYNSSTFTWTALIPQTVTNIMIQRYNPNEPGNGNWNTWGTATSPLIIPGAEDLINSESTAEKEEGITRTYKILGEYEPGTDGVSTYSAGIWDENPNLNHDKGMTFVYTFDATEEKWIDKYNGSTYIDYEYTTSYNKTVHLRYKMSAQLNRYFNRFWRITLPENMDDSKINFYRCANSNEVYKLIDENSWTNQEYKSSSKFFALTGSNTCYQGTAPIYFYHKDSAETMGACCHIQNDAGTFQKMYNIGYGANDNGFTYHAAIVMENKSLVRFARFTAGTSASAMNWDSYIRQANVDVTTTNNNSYKWSADLDSEDDHRKQMFSIADGWKMTVLPNADETAYGYGK